MNLDIKQVHNITRPGKPPRPGDVVEIECVGGFVCAVDPKTRKVGEKHKRFTVGREGNEWWSSPTR